MIWKDPFVPFDRLVSGAGMPQAVEHDAGKLRVFRILHHAQKLRPLLCLRSGNTLVYINLHDFPIWVPRTFNFIPLQLIFQCVDLCLMFC